MEKQINIEKEKKFVLQDYWYRYNGAYKKVVFKLKPHVKQPINGIGDFLTLEKSDLMSLFKYFGSSVGLTLYAIRELTQKEVKRDYQTLLDLKDKTPIDTELFSKYEAKVLSVDNFFLDETPVATKEEIELLNHLTHRLQHYGRLLSAKTLSFYPKKKKHTEEEGILKAQENLEIVEDSFEV